MELWRFETTSSLLVPVSVPLRCCARICRCWVRNNSGCKPFVLRGRLAVTLQCFPRFDAAALLDREGLLFVCLSGWLQCTRRADLAESICGQAWPFFPKGRTQYCTHAFIDARAAITMVFFYDAETYRGLTRLSSPSPKYPAEWQAFVRDTKLLYYKSHYKRCANQCEQMLHEYYDTVSTSYHEFSGQLAKIDQLHPLHKTFLYFYIAICNESLGLVAHKFSSKKLQFLNVAKDAFTAAIVSLPSSYTSAEHDTDELLGLHPQSSGLDGFEYHDPENSAGRSSQLDSSSSRHSAAGNKHSLHERCDSGYDSEPEPEHLQARADTTPDFNSYTATTNTALRTAI